VNEHASRESTREKPKKHHLLLLGLVIVLAAGGYYYWKSHGAPKSAAGVEKILDKDHLSTGLTQLETALKSENLEDVEKSLDSLKDTAVKDSKIAEHEVGLVSASLSKAVKDGHLDKAKALLEKAKASGAVAVEQLKKWEEQISAAEASSSSSASSSAAP
jgi:hypothetical protein